MIKKNLLRIGLPSSAMVWGLALGVALSGSAHAQTLQSYFDFTQYGTVTAGGTVQSNKAGNVSGTLNSASTSLTGGGLAIAGAPNAGTTGLRLANGSLAAFTGDFSIQMWYANTAVNINTGFFGGTSSPTQDNSLAGDSALFVAYGGGGNAGKIRPIESNGTQYGAEQLPAVDTENALNTPYQMTLTYVAATQTFSFYQNGSLVSSGTNSGFSSLAAVTNFSIGGVANPAFGDNAAQQTTASFMMYTGALSGSQVSALQGFGSDVTLAEMESIGIAAVPEPSVTVMLMIAGIGVLVVYRARRRGVSDKPVNV